MSEKDEAMRKFIEYCLTYYGKVSEQQERLAKYAPDIMISWINS